MMGYAPFTMPIKDHSGICIGDSLTFNATYLTPADYYTPKIQTRLYAGRGAVQMLNSGVSGNTTAMALVRANAMADPALPAVAVIYCGTNDYNTSSIGTIQASPTPTATTFTVDAGKGAIFPAGCSLIVGSDSRVVQSVAGDAITLVTPLSGAPSAGASVNLDTKQNLILIANRLATLGYTNQILGIQHYLNYSSSGDTLSSQPALQLAMRVAQNAAAAFLGIPTADFYNWMRNLIVSGVDTQGSYSWHVADQNLHLNAYGETILADCLMASIPASWHSVLST